MKTAAPLPDVLTRATMIARSRPTRVPRPHLAELVGTVVDRYAEQCANATPPDHLNHWLVTELEVETEKLRAGLQVPAPQVPAPRRHAGDVIPRPRVGSA
ncbi:hypothetical protein [Nocardioides sp.]|uniref:hypothetical protein n=1 Tax=Nocardioides sp. TaxID=35761 RepID=UPI0027362238|nr:hypothetical protein [Nocardioides sp.]MDP3889753.1 hypothetical protein [Nocardioides sp.]